MDRRVGRTVMVFTSLGGLTFDGQARGENPLPQRTEQARMIVTKEWNRPMKN